MHQRAQGAYYPPEELYTWWDRTVCEANASDFFVGLFTLVLALSTIGLWWQTERLAEHSEKQLEKMTASIAELNAAAVAMSNIATETAKVALAAQATAAAAHLQIDSLMRAERPHLVVEVPESGVEIGTQGTMRFATNRMKIQFVNYGKTPALLNELVELYPVVEGREDPPPALDPAIDRGRLLPDGTISALDKPYEILTNLMQQTDAMRLYEDDAWQTCRLFFYGYVRFSDTFGTNYIKGFMLVFRPTHNRWIARGGDRWNYTRVESTVPKHPSEQG